MYNIPTWFRRIWKRIVPGIERPGVFILGMHRSGTSCLAGMLEQLGLYLGDVVESARFNAKGNRESPVVAKLNKLLLKQQGGSWYQPTPVTHVAEDLRRQIQAYCRQMKRTRRLWGIKDPRMVFCLDAWREPTTILIGTFRHPGAVARSLHERNQTKQPPLPLSLTDWEQVWFRYNEQLLALYHQAPFPIINFDWDPARYDTAVKHLAQWLALEGRQADFFDDALRHQQPTEAITNPTYQHLYDELVRIAEIEEHKLVLAL